jgi:hypothetical protein
MNSGERRDSESQGQGCAGPHGKRADVYAFVRAGIGGMLRTVLGVSTEPIPESMTELLNQSDPAAEGTTKFASDGVLSQK